MPVRRDGLFDDVAGEFRCDIASLVATHPICDGNKSVIWRQQKLSSFTFRALPTSVAPHIDNFTALSPTGTRPFFGDPSDSIA